METMQQVEQMSDEQVLAAFGTAEDPAGRGFDEATYARVLAYELVRSRQRLTHYRTLYSSFIGEGKLYMVENLDEIGDGDGIPAKLVFSDDAERLPPPVLALDGHGGSEMHLSGVLGRIHQLR